MSDERRTEERRRGERRKAQRQPSMIVAPQFWTMTIEEFCRPEEERP